MFSLSLLNTAQAQWSGTERMMTTSVCLDTDDSAFPYEVGAYWIGTDLEAASLDALEDYQEDTIEVGGVELAPYEYLEVQDDATLFTLKDANDLSLHQKMAICAWLMGYCDDLISYGSAAGSGDDDEDDTTAYCTWTLMSNEQGESSCNIAYQYADDTGDFEIYDCSEISDDDYYDYEGDDDDDDAEDEEEEDDGPDRRRRSARRRAADNFGECEDAAYYRSMGFGDAYTTCEATCSAASEASLDLSSDIAVTTVAAGSTITIDASDYDGLFQFFSIESCDACQENYESDDGTQFIYDQLVGTGEVSFMARQPGFACFAPVLDNELQCDYRQVLQVTGCDADVELTLTFAEEVSTGSVLSALSDLIGDADSSASVMSMSESVNDLLPSTVEEEEEEEGDEERRRRRLLQAFRREDDGEDDGGDDDGEDDDGEDEDGDGTTTDEPTTTEPGTTTTTPEPFEASFSVYSASDVSAVQDALTLDNINSALSDAGVSEASGLDISGSEEESEEAEEAHNAKMQNIIIIAVCTAGVVGGMIAYQVMMCINPPEEKPTEIEKKTLMSGQQAGYGA